MGYLLDTTFWIDLEREGRRNVPGAASRWLEDQREGDLHVSVISLGEFTAGAHRLDVADIQRYFESATLIPVSEAVALRFGHEFQGLRLRGQMIGANDLWIGCTALEHGLALVTRNQSEFSRIEGLEVVTYGA